MSSKKSNMRKETGITLIALIITIIILVILAAVSIRAVTNMGIVGHAINGTQDYARASKQENKTLGDASNYIDNALAKLDKIQEGEKKEPTGKPLVNKETVASIVTGTNLEGEDEFGNPITIPVGFKVAADSGNNVTEGIVIEDDDTANGTIRGNQYVWIPTGTIYTNEARTTSVTITPGRYEFADGTATYKDSNNNTLAKGTPILKQSLANHETQPTNITYHSTTSYPNHGITSATNGEIVIKDYYYELSTYRSGRDNSGTITTNRTATNLEDFANSVETNHGYYIARYEASWGTGNKVKSRVSVGDVPNSAPSSRTNGQLWNFVKQVEAAEACQGLYEGKINSDLMNSYAWDTAIVFLQTFDDREDKTLPYSYQTRMKSGTNPYNTGESGDEICKINDMASNDYEWTTEYSTQQSRYNANPCIYRGGQCNYTYSCTASRIYNNETISYKDVTFRPTLYL